jgi:hypothetical protein
MTNPLLTMNMRLLLELRNTSESRMSEHKDISEPKMSELMDTSESRMSEHLDTSESEISEHTDTSEPRMSEHLDTSESEISEHTGTSEPRMSEHLDTSEPKMSEHKNNLSLGCQRTETHLSPRCHTPRPFLKANARSFCRGNEQSDIN